ncbi:hypothetical protein STEG23_020791 [Scotinomys teguina]
MTSGVLLGPLVPISSGYTCVLLVQWRLGASGSFWSNGIRVLLGPKGNNTPSKTCFLDGGEGGSGINSFSPHQRMKSDLDFKNETQCYLFQKDKVFVSSMSINRCHNEHSDGLSSALLPKKVQDWIFGDYKWVLVVTMVMLMPSPSAPLDTISERNLVFKSIKASFDKAL